MNIIWTLVIGLVIGALAKLVMPGKDPGGAFLTIVIGIAGSVLAHIIGVAAGWYTPSEPAGFVTSIAGAVLLLAGYRFFTGRQAS
jgi:uncharacterized membrane protein YeaQ/YmgE (transglycosylase-associated protein family)